MQQIEIIYPDDWHCHLREGDALRHTVPDIAKQFKRAIVMPNLRTPVTDVMRAQWYKQDITAFTPKDVNFTPLMTLYLTDATTPQIIQEAKASGIIFGCKLYPAGVTTHSQAGVSNLQHIYPILETMEKVGLPLLIHGEVNDAEVDIFDREAIFIDKHLVPLLAYFPALKIVLEHITTSEAVDFVKAAPANIGATITAHHLYYNRNALFVGGIKPHHYCLPVLKRKTHQDALIQAAISGNPHFFLGTDSAPHPISKKEAACGCAGIYTAHAAIEIYTEIFENHGALDKLEGFASRFGPDFYGLPYNTEKCILRKKSWRIPPTLPLGETKLIPFLAGEMISWEKI